jgi:hypothetical protein
VVVGRGKRGGRAEGEAEGGVEGVRGENTVGEEGEERGGKGRGRGRIALLTVGRAKNSLWIGIRKPSDRRIVQASTTDKAATRNRIK